MQNFIQKHTPPSIKNALNLFLVLYLLLGVGLDFIAKHFGDNYESFINKILFALIILILIIIMRKQNLNVAEIFSIRKISYRKIILSILIGVCASFIFGCLQDLIKALINPTFSVILAPINALKINLTFFEVYSAIILAPLCEELYFRGYLLSAFKKFGFIQAIIFSAFLFSFLHWDSIGHIITASIGGLIYGYLVYRTGSIFSSILAHTSFNATVVIIIYFGHFDIYAKDPLYIILTIISAVLIMPLLQMLIKDTSPEEIDKVRFRGFWNNIKSLLKLWQFKIIVLMFLFVLIHAVLSFK